MIIRLPFGLRIVIGKEFILTSKDLSQMDLTKAQQVPNNIVNRVIKSREERRDNLLKSPRKSMGKLDWKKLIGVKPPKDAPVTEQTIAQCIWNSMFTRRGSLPEEIRKKVKPGMSREKIIEIVKGQLEK